MHVGEQSIESRASNKYNFKSKSVSRQEDTLEFGVRKLLLVNLLN